MKRRKANTIDINTDNIESPLTQEHVEWATGGPDGSYIKLGGTCIRPDIRLHNDYHCDGCDYFKYCLVSSKKL